MCYSAQIERDYRKYFRVVGSDKAMSIEDFIRIYWWREQDFPSIKIPKSIDAWFANPKSEDEARIAQMIRDYNAKQIAKFEQEIFKQRKRLADAERTLQTKTTKKATDDKRVATSKIEQNFGWLNDVKRSEPKDKDARIFPGFYAPVIVSETGRRTIKLMRYQCRPAGKPKFLDKDLTTFNARRDNLGGNYWKPLFGYSHGIMIINSFFEHVSRHKVEGRELKPGEKEADAIIEFRPRPSQEMYVACLWSHWQEAEDELDSFAAITDEPPAEIAAAGHDRCVIPIKEENIDAWLNPNAKNLDALHAILDDRARPYYEYSMAA